MRDFWNWPKEFHRISKEFPKEFHSISQFINNIYCWIYCSYTLHILFRSETKITLFYVFLFAFICFHLLYHLLSSVFIRYHSLYHSLSLVVSLVVSGCHSLYHSLSFIVTCCHSLSLAVPLVATRCHSLSLNIPLVYLLIKDRQILKRKEKINRRRKMTKAATGGVLKEKVLLEISQNSQENTCARVSLLKKGFWRRCLPVNFAKFLRTPLLQNTSGRLLLKWIFLHLIYSSFRKSLEIISSYTL